MSKDDIIRVNDVAPWKSSLARRASSGEELTRSTNPVRIRSKPMQATLSSVASLGAALALAASPALAASAQAAPSTPDTFTSPAALSAAPTEAQRAALDAILATDPAVLQEAVSRELKEYRGERRAEASAAKKVLGLYNTAQEAQAAQAKVFKALQSNEKKLEVLQSKKLTSKDLPAYTKALQERETLVTLYGRNGRTAERALKAYNTARVSYNTLKATRTENLKELQALDSVFTLARTSDADPHTIAHLGRLQTDAVSSGVASHPVPLAARKIADNPVCNTNFQTYPNGDMPAEARCPLSFTRAKGHSLRPHAARDMNALMVAYEADLKKPFCITDSYRDYATQVSLKAQKPVLAAKPGTSNHGLGMAVDLCGGIGDFGSKEHQWMRANAPYFGWNLPSWARQDGSKPEPWHWEYTAAEKGSTLQP